MEDSRGLQFTFVGERKPRWSALAISFLLQAIGILLLIRFGVIEPKVILTTIKHYNVVELAADRPTAHPRPPQQIIKKPAIARPDLAHLFETRTIPVTSPARPQPVAELKIAEQKAPVVPVQRVPQVGQFESAPVAVAAARPAPAVTIGGFSSGSSAAPTLNNVKSRDVQTGGFGDPNGIKGVGDGKGKLVAAAVGSFDLPGGPGHGNGTGGAKGARGTIASAGFGNGVATATPGNVSGGTAARGSIQQGGFGDARVIVDQPRTVRNRGTENAQSPTSPVEILSKPNPVYTDEARALKVEGEVLLEVVFTASGEPRVSRVVRGLGHGLDQSATRAAERIRYKPAKRDGQPVDSAAVIHVVFQLAY